LQAGLALLTAATLAGAARAADPAGTPMPPLRSPAQLQQEQAPVLQQQQEEQNQAENQALRGHHRPLMDQCTRLLRQQWKTGGVVQLLSAHLIDGSPAYVRGRAGFPGDGGVQEVHRYRCYYNAHHTAIVRATIGRIVLGPAP
jgi:hypothetical protein